MISRRGWGWRKKRQVEVGSGEGYLEPPRISKFWRTANLLIGATKKSWLKLVQPPKIYLGNPLRFMGRALGEDAPLEGVSTGPAVCPKRQHPERTGMARNTSTIYPQQ